MEKHRNKSEYADQLRQMTYGVLLSVRATRAMVRKAKKRDFTAQEIYDFGDKQLRECTETVKRIDTLTDDEVFDEWIKIMKRIVNI